MADAVETDLIKVERGSALYQLQVGSLASLLDDDLVEVERGGVVYKETGLNVKADLPSGPPAYDPDAQDYITRVETADGQTLEDAVKDAINQLFLDLKAVNVDGSVHTCYLYDAARSMAGARESLFAANQLMGLTNLVDGDYTRGNGLSGDGSTKYGTTFRSCSFGNIYCMGFYSGNDGTTDPCMLGVQASNSVNWFIHGQAPGNVNFRASQISSNVATGFYAQNEMIFATSLLSSSNNYYIKAASVISESRIGVASSTGLAEFGIHARNVQNGGANAYSVGPIKAAVILNDNSLSLNVLQDVCVAFNTYHAAISAALTP